MDKTTVMVFLRGRAEAAQFMERERMERLARLRPEEARRIYDEFCQLWEKTARKEATLEILDRLKIEDLLARRRAFARLEEKKGEQAV